MADALALSLDRVVRAKVTKLDRKGCASGVIVERQSLVCTGEVESDLGGLEVAERLAHAVGLGGIGDDGLRSAALELGVEVEDGVGGSGCGREGDERGYDGRGAHFAWFCVWMVVD